MHALEACILGLGRDAARASQGQTEIELSQSPALVVHVREPYRTDL